MVSSNMMQASSLACFLAKGLTDSQSSLPPKAPPDRWRVILSWETAPSSTEDSPVDVTCPKLLSR